MQYPVEAAKSQLSKLVDAAIAGEDVVLAKGEKPAVRLVAVPQQNGFKIGLLDGLLGEVPGFLEPMSEEDLAIWEGGHDSDGEIQAGANNQ